MKKSYNDDTCNLIKHIQIQKQLQLHEKRILNSKPTLNFKSTGFLTNNNQNIRHIKKQPLAEFNRIVSINIENKALLDKLTNQPRSKIGTQKPHKLVKNNRKKNFDEYNRRLENQGLSKRIREAKSSYKMEKYVSERKRTEKYVNSICKYGYKDFKPNKTIISKTLNNNFCHTRRQDSAIQSNSHNPSPSKHDPSQSGSYTSIPMIKQMILQRELPVKTKKFTSSIQGVFWTHKISLQIDCSDGNTYKLEVPIKKFVEDFKQNIEYLISKVKFNEKQMCFTIQNS